uniref:Helicase POLQ-like n=1 Tax=Parastrongyloides trichosuri TaxID=131310 RepID=A0A0N4ZV25_PARTI
MSGSGLEDTSDSGRATNRSFFVKSWQLLDIDLDIENEEIVPVKRRRILQPLVPHNDEIVTKFNIVSGRSIVCSQKVAEEFKSPFLNNSTLPPLIELSPDHHSANNNGNNGARSMSTKELFSKLDLPEKLYDYYISKRKINDLYTWQKQCLTDSKLLRGSNIILSLPTGAGKTLIAELLMLREIVNNKKNCILVLPYVAIVQEKIASFMEFKDMFDINILDYSAGKGSIPPEKIQNGNGTIYIATIEKANILINSLISNKRINEIGLMVLDELHMIGETSRGILIEQMITKYLTTLCGQIIGMSATLDDMNYLKKFMKAHVLSVDFRPVTLDQKVKIFDKLYSVDESSNYRKLIPIVNPPDNSMYEDSRDTDGIIPFLRPLIPNRGVLVFCPTKDSCEKLCNTLSEILADSNIFADNDPRKYDLIDLIRSDNGGRICEIMEYGILSGVGYHHSGITIEERSRIETAFKNGIIHTLCATSTLAAGVNLPARRVIIKDPFLFNEIMSKSQYTQMVGRAGRAGLNNYGDSVTIITTKNKEKQFRAMIETPHTICKSQMEKSTIENKNFQILILDVICLGMAKTKKDLEKIVLNTLYGYENPSEMPRILNNVLVKLISYKMLEEKENVYYATPLGIATQSANFSPEVAVKIKEDLDYHLENGIILSSDLHLIFILLQSDFPFKIKESLLNNEIEFLRRDDPKLFSIIVDTSYQNFVLEFSTQTQAQYNTKYKKLYILFIIKRLLKKESIWDVANEFQVQRGWIQNMLQLFFNHTRCVIRFAEKIPEFWPVIRLVPHVLNNLIDSITPSLESLRSTKVINDSVFDKDLIL